MATKDLKSPAVTRRYCALKLAGALALTESTFSIGEKYVEALLLYTVTNPVFALVISVIVVGLMSARIWEKTSDWYGVKEEPFNWPFPTETRGPSDWRKYI